MELLLSGIVSLIVSFIMFWLSGIWDSYKDKKRLKIEKINLYNAIKFLRQAILSQLDSNNKIISEIDNNLSQSFGTVHFSNVKINSDIKAYALKQLKSDDISKILIHEHKDKTDERAYYHHLLLENIPLAEHTVDSLKQIQENNHSDIENRNQKISDAYTEIRNTVIKEFSILNKNKVLSVEEIALMQCYSNIQNLIVEFFEQNMGQQPIGLENYYDISMRIFRLAAPLEIHEILNLCGIIFNTYAEVRALNVSVRDNLLEVNKALINIKNTCENIQKLEYPERDQDFVTLQTHSPKELTMG